MSGVEIEGVSRRFGSVAAVDNVDLKVEPGEFVTLLGPSPYSRGYAFYSCE